VQFVDGSNDWVMLHTESSLVADNKIYLQTMLPGAQKVYEPCTRVLESISYLNLIENRKLYDASRGSDYLNFAFTRKINRELFDF
jgi:hypothetical protein